MADNKKTDSPAEIMQSLQTSFSTDPFENPGETHRFYTTTSDPKFKEQISTFNENRRKHDDPAFDAMKVKDSIVNQSDVSIEVARLRRTKTNKFQCESVHSAGWRNGRLHIAPPILAKNASRADAAQTHAGFVFGALAAKEDVSIVRHSGSGYAKVDAELDNRLPGNDNPVISPREVGEIRHLGGGHKERITIVESADYVPLNPQASRLGKLKGLVSNVVFKPTGYIMSKIKGSTSYIVRGFRITRYSVHWVPPQSEKSECASE